MIIVDIGLSYISQQKAMSISIYLYSYKENSSLFNIYLTTMDEDEYSDLWALGLLLIYLILLLGLKDL